MSWFEATRTRMRLAFSRRRVESRMDAEFRFHLEMETERLVREAGLTPEEARRQAAVAFGGVEKHKEELRDGRGLAWLSGMSLDLKLGVRMLLKSPGLTVIGVLGLSVAVAIGTISFAIIYNFIGVTLPLDEGDRVVVIQSVDTRGGVEGDETHLHDLATWREELRAVDEIAAYRIASRNIIVRRGSPSPMRIAEMSASGFRIARVPPLLGRYFHDDDDRAGAPPVVVIGYDVWQNRFASERDVVGQSIQIGATIHTIVGVMPKGFAFPVNNQLWAPLRLNPSAFARGNAPPVQVFGRLARGATLDDAQAQLTTIGKRLAAEYPESHSRLQSRVRPFTLSFVDNPELAWMLHLVQLMVSMLLVVIGTNVATLVYARTASRMGEIAVRTALGASRRRIVAQLFLEALVLSSAAAIVGLVAASIALWNIRAYAKRFAGEQIPFWMDFGLSPGLMLYVVALAIVGAVIVGVFPALKATGRRVQANLQQVGMSGSGIQLGKTWTVLIVSQVAVAVALLPVVLYASFVQRSDPALSGPKFATGEWVTTSLALDREGAPRSSERDAREFATRYAAIGSELVRRLEAEPGVAAVVATSAAPGHEPKMRMEVERARGASTGGDAPTVALARKPIARVRVDLDFFRAFGVPILTGRELNAGDASSDATTVIVNRTFVRQILGDGEALGRRIREPGRKENSSAERTSPGPWYEIVGVVPDFPTPQSAADVAPKMYQPLIPGTAEASTLAIRIRGAAPETYAGRFRELAVAVDPMLRLEDIRALDDPSSVQRMADRVIFTSVALVTLSVLLLSAAGIYALISFTIVRRRREIGIRAALGAGPRHVLWSVLMKAARQIGMGIAIGIAVAGIFVQGMEGGLADRRGAFILVAVIAIMTIVGLVAAFGPARRALRIQPTEALRSE